MAKPFVSTFRTSVELAVALALALCPACASLGPPGRTSGPSVSSEGVRLEVAAQSCTQSSDIELPEADLGEAVLEVHVSNGTAAPLTVRRDDFRLVTPDGYALRSSSWGAAKPLVVVGGETRAFELRFQARGSLTCGHELRLEPRAGLVVGSKPAAVDPVRFIPSKVETPTS
ncbi:MAG TPA: hypothetical protein VK989_13485 [Polyangia bacterium]|jgi:hypothetical protein|nr:hypothetical protein [Polyangia bacterium]